MFSHEPGQRTALRDAIRRHAPDSIAGEAMRDALVAFADPSRTMRTGSDDASA